MRVERASEGTEADDGFLSRLSNILLKRSRSAKSPSDTFCPDQVLPSCLVCGAAIEDPEKLEIGERVHDDCLEWDEKV